ncbi:unnamed protein product [Pleuronectes platessa]|uniref:Uncharacterized protein n=1 Tax=Pleuronectes platessa TaxID=8262 RepID=A0A9N7VC11_PLEPL|nr:unnamed protein product [Pleuronectes platessa]
MLDVERQQSVGDDTLDEAGQSGGCKAKHGPRHNRVAPLSTCGSTTSHRTGVVENLPAALEFFVFKVTVPCAPRPASFEFVLGNFPNPGGQSPGPAAQPAEVDLPEEIEKGHSVPKSSGLKIRVTETQRENRYARLKTTIDLAAHADRHRSRAGSECRRSLFQTPRGDVIREFSTSPGPQDAHSAPPQLGWKNIIENHTPCWFIAVELMCQAELCV